MLLCQSCEHTAAGEENGEALWEGRAIAKDNTAGTHSQFSEAKPTKPEPSASQADGSEEE